MGMILQCGARADVRQAATGAQVGAVARRAGNAESGKGPAGVRDRGPRPSPLPSPRGEGRDNNGARGDTRPPILNVNGKPARPSPGVTILAPKAGAMQRWDEWMWKELRFDGGLLKEYLAMEKRQTEARLRAVAREMDGFEQNNQSDFRLKAAVPMREYLRWKREDPHFWDDDANLRSWKRDNPDAVVKL